MHRIPFIMYTISMRYNLKNYKFLDGEELFKKYFEEMGTARSINKLVKWCISSGKINPQTGKPPTRMGVWKAMWRWALLPENSSKAFEIFRKSLSSDGEFVGIEKWNEYIHSKAVHGLQFGPKRYEEFIKTQR